MSKMFPLLNYQWKQNFKKEHPKGINKENACQLLGVRNSYYWEAVSSECSVVSDSATPRTIAHQTPLPMRFSRQECQSGLPRPSPRDLPDPKTESMSLASPILQADSLPLESPGKPILGIYFDFTSSRALSW